MKNFISTILSHELFALYLFYYKYSFSNSEEEKEMKEYSAWSRTDFSNEYEKTETLRIIFLAENTNWQYIDKESNCVGVLGNSIISSDTDGQFHYMCEGFQNIPLLRIKYLKEQNEFEKFKNEFKNTYKIDFENLLLDYKKLCNQFNLPLSLIEKEEEFEREIKEKIKK